MTCAALKIAPLAAVEATAGALRPPQTETGPFARGDYAVGTAGQGHLCVGAYGEGTQNLHRGHVQLAVGAAPGPPQRQTAAYDS